MVAPAVCSTAQQTSLTEYTRRIETVLRSELEAAQHELSSDNASQHSAERYRKALTRFNDFVIHREIPAEYQFPEDSAFAARA